METGKEITSDVVEALVHEIELARRRAVESIVDSATPYLGVVEEISADGATVRVRRVDEAAGSGRWLARPAGHRPAVGTQLPVVLTTGLNARGQLEAVGIALPPLGGDYTGGFGVAGVLAVEGQSGTSLVKVGRAGFADMPIVDFDSSVHANGSDARISTAGGAAAAFQGTLNVQALAVTHNGLTMWDHESAQGPSGGGLIVGGHITTDAINARHIVPDAIGSVELAGASVKTEHLGAGAVVGAKIAASTITPTHLDRAYSVTGHDHDNRYYTQGTSDGRYYTQGTSDGRYYTKATSDDRYYTKATSDDRYSLAAHTHDTRYFTQATADGRFLAKAAALDHNGTTAGFLGAAPVSRRGAPSTLATDGTATSGQMSGAINTLRSGLIALGLFG